MSHQSDNRRVVVSGAKTLMQKLSTTIKSLCSPRGRPLIRFNSSSSTENNLITINKTTYSQDEWTNISKPIFNSIGRNIHLQPCHPIGIIRDIVESHFPAFSKYSNLPPNVSVKDNFDDLGFAMDHPGRSKTDTYYINKDNVLRTHTSAHQTAAFRESDQFLITADVYRRDAIDRSHYPVFHQMEGAKLWPKHHDIENTIQCLQVSVEQPAPPFHSLSNPVQPQHSLKQVEAVVRHLKTSLEGVIADIFSKINAGEHMKVRWVETFFPFTSPSWELEVWWNDQWLELLGCGVIQQRKGEMLGWAFGLGLERIAMILFGIPDIRLFWSLDPRFLEQFQANSISVFKPYSMYPSCYKDVSFWENTSSFHENDFMELIRGIAGDLVEDVKLIDKFIHPKTHRRSFCYRINYRSMDRSLTHNQVNSLQQLVRNDLVAKLGVELR
ncbi:Phenylalanine--tRNA ligase, mitochondrial [Neolecta irregularis DAH-3]|uniref:Phenylalanine--tRNA ligase, mitochondrial n=1 Tax=Neolecta irregularis (strain DAH-3) TaxID=1198029 RepID=A0A1U7LNG3_NEOID|nr:Phenylalanine--tRNA ligase, mitochondrial [Neolecta irregularis DAH-3]|eukprot:OLL24210.1 Phenylalanine--tRNA ligase, mitochondrial [Neolecta irregularis DAH-3]